MSEGDYCRRCGDVQRLPREVIETFTGELRVYLEDALRLCDLGDRSIDATLRVWPELRDALSSANARAVVLAADARGWCVTCSRVIVQRAAELEPKRAL